MNDITCASADLGTVPQIGSAVGRGGARVGEKPGCRMTACHCLDADGQAETLCLCVPFRVYPVWCCSTSFPSDIFAKTFVTNTFNCNFRISSLALLPKEFSKCVRKVFNKKLQRIFKEIRGKVMFFIHYVFAEMRKWKLLLKCYRVRTS